MLAVTIYALGKLDAKDYRESGAGRGRFGQRLNISVLVEKGERASGALQSELLCDLAMQDLRRILG